MNKKSNVISNTKYGEKFFDDIISACQIIYNITKETMGPQGKYIIISRKYDDPKATRDGVTVAKNVKLSNPIYDSIGKIFLQGISRTNDIAGDGTTATTVLSYALLNISYKMSKAGWSIYKIVSSLSKLQKLLLMELQDISKKVQNHEDLVNVASISANSGELGKIIAEAFNKVGHSGAITVDIGTSNKTVLDITKGLVIKDSGFADRRFINFKNKNMCELNDASIIIISSKKDNNMRDYHKLMQVLFQSDKNKGDFLIITDNIRDEIVHTFVKNLIHPLGAFKGRNICIVKLSSFGVSKDNELEDLSIACGAKIIGSEHGLPLHLITNNVFGKANKVKIYNNKTIIINGGGSDEDINNHKSYLKNLMTNVSTEYDKSEIKKRLARLGKGVVQIKAGGSTNVEAENKKARIEDALSSTRFAWIDGIVPGGGIIYLLLLNRIKQKYANNQELNIGIKILEEAFVFPAKCIIINSGQNCEYIVENLKLKIKENPNIGYDILSQSYVDMYDKGIIDPTKVVQCVIKHSFSIAKILLNSKGITIDDTKNTNEPRANY